MGKHVGSRKIGRPRSRRNNNIKITWREKEGGVDWNDVASDRENVADFYRDGDE